MFIIIIIRSFVQSALFAEYVVIWILMRSHTPPARINNILKLREYVIVYRVIYEHFFAFDVCFVGRFVNIISGKSMFCLHDKMQHINI